jgi:hypothetical protein
MDFAYAHLSSKFSFNRIMADGCIVCGGTILLESVIGASSCAMDPGDVVRRPAATSLSRQHKKATALWRHHDSSDAQ